VIIPNF